MPTQAASQDKAQPVDTNGSRKEEKEEEGGLKDWEYLRIRAEDNEPSAIMK